MNIKVYVIIFAGGVGARMGSDVPKQFLKVDNKEILVHTLENFSLHKEVDGIILVSKEEYISLCKQLISKYGIEKINDIVSGGDTGQKSIYNGLKRLNDIINAQEEDHKCIVMINDGVRPVISEKLISESIACVKENGNSIAVSKAIETVIRINTSGDVIDTVDRSECRHAKAPQCFYFEDLWKAHQRARKEGVSNMIDSATLMSYYGTVLHTTECSTENIKITTPVDYYMFKALYEKSQDETFR